MDFYGIPVQEGSVRKENDYLSAKVKVFNDVIQRHEKEKKHVMLAIDILKEFTEKSKTYFPATTNQFTISIDGKDVCKGSYEEDLLNKYLKSFGLKVEN